MKSVRIVTLRGYPIMCLAMTMGDFQARAQGHQACVKNTRWVSVLFSPVDSLPPVDV